MGLGPNQSLQQPGRPLRGRYRVQVTMSGVWRAVVARPPLSSNRRGHSAVHPKTLFRILLKFAGVCLFIFGLLSLIPECAALLTKSGSSPVPPLPLFYHARTWTRITVQLAAGLYLFFRSSWIVDAAFSTPYPCLLGATLAFLIPATSAVLTPTPAGISSTWIYGSLGTAENPVYCIGDHTTTPIASRLILEFQHGAEVLWSLNTGWADFGPPDVPQWAAPALRDAIAPKKVMLDARGWPFRAFWLSADLDEGGSVAAVSGGLNLRTSLSSVPRDPIILPLRPILLGLLGDTAVYVLIVLILGMFTIAVRRCLRFEQGRCPTCGYDRSGQYEQACPECGNCHLTNRSS